MFMLSIVVFFLNKSERNLEGKLQLFCIGVQFEVNVLMAPLCISRASQTS